MYVLTIFFYLFIHTLLDLLGIAKYVEIILDLNFLKEFTFEYHESLILRDHVSGKENLGSYLLYYYSTK